MAQITLKARGWTITDARSTEGELILIASRRRRGEGTPSPELGELG
jgi:hypothetical protein